MSVVVTKATPAPGIAKLIVPESVWEKWTKREIFTRRCLHCKNVYRFAGAAWVCEHYHEGI